MNDEIARNWNDLPTEVKLIVLRNANLRTIFCVGFCSKSDWELIDSVEIELEFLRIGYSDEGAQFLMGRNDNDILRIDLLNDGTFYRSNTFEKDTIQRKSDVKSLDSSIFQKILGSSIKIDTLHVEIQTKNHDCRMIADLISRKSPKKVILTGNTKHLEKIAKTEVLIRDWSKDNSRNWDDWKHHGFRAFEVSKWKNREHIKAKVEIELVLFIAMIEAHAQLKTYLAPGLKVENVESKMEMFRGTIIENNSKIFLKEVPITPKKAMFIKVTPCGVCVQISEKNEMDESCGLGWLCSSPSTCSLENRYFRDTILNLHK